MFTQPRHGYLLGLLLATFVAPTYTLSDSPWQRYVHKNWLNRVQLTEQPVGKGISEVTEDYFEQKLDHFYANDTRTWKQRYFVRSRWTPGESNGPVFLCVGGEGPPLDKNVLDSSPHCTNMVEMATQGWVDKDGKHNAYHSYILFAVEHRYYGKSLPLGPDFKTENLAYLSSRQALQDLVIFKKFAQEKYQINSKSNWVAFGGSYPGMLAAWTRTLAHGQLTHASVASSAPVEAILNYHAYNGIVGKAISMESVGGSQKCWEIVTYGHQGIGELMKEEAGRGHLKKLFNIRQNTSILADPKIQYMWAGNGVVYLPVQGNDPECMGELCNIQKICQFLENTADGTSHVDALAYLARVQNGGQEVSLVYEDIFSNLENPFSTDRIWLYQTCNEFGFYQTCEEGCPYLRGLNGLAQDLEICWKVFSINETTVKSNIAATNKHYKGKNMVHFYTRIAFANGEIDPWTVQAVQKVDRLMDQKYYMIPAASHHYWTHPSNNEDPEAVKVARQRIRQAVAGWLLED